MGKRWLAVTTPALLAFGAWTVWAAQHRSPVDHSVMWYYTDYLAFFLNNGGVSALPQILPTNLVSLVMLAGDSILHDLSGSMFGRFLAVIVFAAAVSGTFRLVRRTGSLGYPVFCGLLMVVLLAWNFSPNARLAAPLMPLLAMALWEEGEHVASLIAKSARSSKRADRMAAHLFRAGLLAGLVAAAALNVQFIFQGLPRLLAADRAAAEQEQRVFAWCKEYLPPAAVVLADNDTRFFLATGRSAVRAVPDSVAFYRNDEAAKMKVITEFDAFQRAFGITHILLTPADFADFESPQRDAIAARLAANPRHREIFRSGPFAVLEIEPVVASAVSGR